MTKLSTLALLLSITACTTESAEGLQLDVADDTRVAGTYSHDGVAVAFDFSRDEYSHTLAFHAADGRPLITTTLEGAYQTTTVFDGELVASGIANAPHPTILGDRTAMERLHALPEAALLDGLREALMTEGVDETLLSPQPPEVQGVYDYDGRYYVFSPGDQQDWLSAAGANPTYVYAQNPWPTYGKCAVVRIEPWSPAAQDLIVVEPYSSASKTGYWWGAIITVRNTGSIILWTGRRCESSSLLVRVSPYRWSP